MTRKKELTGKPAVMKEINISLIVDALQTLGSASRVELCNYTKISQPTVNQLIRELMTDNTVLSLGSADSTGGRKAEIFTLNSKRSAIACITVTMNGFTCCITDMNLTEECSFTCKHQDGASYTEELCTVIEKLLEEAPDTGAISIGLPGAVSEKGIVYAISQIPEWEDQDIGAILRKRFPLPVSVINDINATALGYLKIDESDCQNLIYLQINGAGLGAGIIIGRRLYPGFASFAGEAGYMQIGNRQSVESQLLCAEAATKADLLSQIVINMICLLNPDKIVIGGAEITDQFMSIIEAACKKALPPSVLPVLSGTSSSTECYQKGLADRGFSLLDKGVHLLK